MLLKSSNKNLIKHHVALLTIPTITELFTFTQVKNAIIHVLLLEYSDSVPHTELYLQHMHTHTHTHRT